NFKFAIYLWPLANLWQNESHMRYYKGRDFPRAHATVECTSRPMPAKSYRPWIVILRNHCAVFVYFLRLVKLLSGVASEVAEHAIDRHAKLAVVPIFLDAIDDLAAGEQCRGSDVPRTFQSVPRVAVNLAKAFP